MEGKEDEVTYGEYERRLDPRPQQHTKPEAAVNEKFRHQDRGNPY